MTDINPLASSLLSSAQVQQGMQSEKVQQARRLQNRSKNTTAATDQFEPSVESTEELAAIHDTPEEHPQRRKPRPQNYKLDTPEEDEDAPHLDLTA